MIVKACPFCGGRPYIEAGQRGFVGGVSAKVCYVRCLECGARSPRVDLADYGCTSRSSKAVDDVLEMWNRRAENVVEYELKRRVNKVMDITADDTPATGKEETADVAV